MLIFFVVLSVIAVATVASRWLYMSNPERRLRALDKMARQVDLAVDPAMAATLGRRLVRRERAGIVGYLIALAVVLPLDLLWVQHTLRSTKPPPYTPLTILLPWLGISAATLVGRTSSALVDAHRPTQGRRLARSHTPALTDYVRPADVTVTRLLVLVVDPVLVVVFLLRNQGGPLGRHPWLALVGAVAAVAVLVAAELAARALLRVGQPAQSPAELAWDDAFRAVELRQLYLTAAMAGIFVGLFAFVGIQPPDALQPILIFGLVAAVPAFAFLGKPASHYRRRLWPSPMDAAQSVTWRST